MLDKLKHEHWIIYYIVLGIIQALWTNGSAFPPSILRLGMMLAVVLPILKHYELVLFAIPFNLILRGNFSTPYQYLPEISPPYVYLLVIVACMFLHAKKINFTNYKHAKLLLVFVFYMTIIDTLNCPTIGYYAMNLCVAILIIPFLKEKTDIHILSSAFIYSCAILAAYYIVMYDKFLNTWSEGLERSGWSDPNYYATLLDMGFFVISIYICGILRNSSVIFNKKILIIISFVIFYAVVLTASRAGFICYIVILLFILIKCKIKWYWYIVGLFLLVASVIAMFMNGAFDVLIYRLLEEGSASEGNGRFEIWDMTISNFTNESLLTQFFGGGYWYRAIMSKGFDTHNEFIAILLDYGYIGFLLYSSFIMSNCIFKKNLINSNIPIILYILFVMSLSPFQYLNVGFYLIWIFAYRRFILSGRNSSAL